MNDLGLESIAMHHELVFRAALNPKNRNQVLLRFISNLASKNEQDSKRPDISIFSAFKSNTPELPKLTLLDLPPEVFRRIIYHLHCSGQSLIPLITSCKQFYDTWAYLIYMTKVVQIDDDTRFRSGRGSSSSLKAFNTLNYLKNHKIDVAAHITVLNFKTRTSFFQLDKLPKISKTFFDFLPSMIRLVVLTIDSNEPRTLFQSFCHLPKNLEVFMLRINLTKHQISRINPKLFIETHFNKLSRVKKLEYIEVESTQYELSYKKIHPEFGSFNWNSLMDENLSFGNFFNTKMAHLIDTINLNRNKFLIKERIGELIFNFLQKNRFRFIKIEILNIDLRLIFDQNNFRMPFTFDRLRMLVFDNTSRIFLQDWLSYFQQANQVPGPRGYYPLLVCLDRLGERLYYQHTRLADLENLLNIETWLHSNLIRAQYAVLNQQRGIKY